MKTHRRDIVVIGASAGGVSALRELVSRLPTHFPAAVFIVLHTPPDGTSVLPELLARSGALPAAHARDGDAIREGHIYVAPPDRHLMLEGDRMRVLRGPRENNARPAVDPLFRSAALSYGERVIGVILTGNLNDGTSGLMTVKARGGTAIVQDPADALYPSMPWSAKQVVEVDHSVPLAEIAKLLTFLVKEPMNPRHTTPDTEKTERAKIEIAEMTTEEFRNEELSDIGSPSVFTCPDCAGTLWEIRDERMLRFRCRVGHAFTAESLFQDQVSNIENVLWSAMRALEEQAALACRIANRAEASDLRGMVDRFRAKQEEAEYNARLLRELLERQSDGLLGADPVAVAAKEGKG